MIRKGYLIFLLFVIGVVFADNIEENHNKPEISAGLFKSEYHVRRLNLPFYGINIGVKSDKSFWKWNGRIFSSHYKTEFSSNEIAYQHYFWGVGVSAKKTLWKILYIDLGGDYIQYNVKNEAAKEDSVFFIFGDNGVRSSEGIIWHGSIGLEFFLAQNWLVYGGYVSSVGKIAMMRTSDEIDEVFDFTSGNKYEAGISYVF